MDVPTRDKLRMALLQGIYDQLGPNNHGPIEELAKRLAHSFGGTDDDAIEAYEYLAARDYFQDMTTGWGVQLSPRAVDEIEATRRRAPASRQVTQTAKRKEQPYGGRWRIVRSLSEGGQAHTFVVVDDSGALPGEFVLKRLKNIARVARFEREAKAALALDHPNILKVVDYDVSGSKPYIVSEYHSRGPITYDYFARMNLVARLDVCLSISQAFCHAHSRGVIHRDIKPENILVRTDGAPVVCDFGLCYIEGEDRLTESSEVHRNWFCTAPEVEEGRVEDVRPSADVYCLGKLFYWTITGKTFGREKHREPAFDLTAQTPRSAHAFVNELLDLMIVQDSAARLASACDVVELLQRVIQKVRMNAHPIDIEAPQECLYCGTGMYEVTCDPRWWFYNPNDPDDQRRKKENRERALAEFSLPGALGEGSPWVILRCRDCGNVQIFKPTGRVWERRGR